MRIKGQKAVLAADGDEEQVACDDLVVVAEFGERIYPGLRRLGSIDRGGGKPAHVVIKGENYHALEALRFSHAGKVDCIYIDPPYNTGARDWKYDNDYVDADDGYRHSKWLAFMERRLRLAKELLNPDDSVLIVAIDEKEYSRLGLLLDQLFADAQIQMVTTVIKPEGTGRVNEFSRTNEFLYFVMIGHAEINAGPDNMYDRDGSESGRAVEWRNLRRRERTSVRGSRPRQFYAVFVDEQSGRIHSVGEPIPDGVDRESISIPAGTRAVFPLRPNGDEMIWSLIPSSLRELVDKGYARATDASVQFLNSGTVAAIENGDAVVHGYDDRGAVIAEFTAPKSLMPKTVWTREAHNSQTAGTLLLKRFVPGRDFPFPKSLYAVEDAIRFFVGNKRNATVLDFFAGSGTTTHAVARLNRQDNGMRQSISITNNEVSADEASELRSRGLLPGDEECEELGIFQQITRPRIAAAISGVTSDGEPVEGDYRSRDEFPMAEGFEENVEFVELKYLDIEDVELDLAFEAVAPLLWLRAGATGPVIDRRCDDGGKPKHLDVTDRYGVLFDPDHWRAFVEKVPESVTTVFVVPTHLRCSHRWPQSSPLESTSFASMRTTSPPSPSTEGGRGALRTLRLPARGRSRVREEPGAGASRLGGRPPLVVCALGDHRRVIATAVIEALIHGSSDLGVDPDPRATFLWVTDDPALNRQTRNKMIAGSDLLQPARLVILDDGFMNDELSTGRVYFLNIQKLSKAAGLSKGGNNLRQHSFWDILANTIKGDSRDLYVVLDEAHRGMRSTQGRKTIVQQIIGGKAGSNPSAPMVWGISATIERFNTAMAGVTDRTDYPPVQVDIEKVRASGLVKDEIGLDEPDEKGSFGSTLLREAVQATLDYEQRWTTYSEDTGEPAVFPVLVLQVPDKASKDKLGELVQVIESEWSGLGPHAVAHVFGEHEPIELDTRTLRWVHPESIQDDTDVRIVMAKTAISTGWDCPRAEVLYSERPASDATHIAQVVGRMVRQPLAHRIATDDALNSVACFLPKFDRARLGTIKAELEGAGKVNGEGALGATVVRDPKVFERNGSLDPEVFALVESLKGLPAPDILASPLRRARVLAQLLTDDKSGSALMPDAGQQLTKTLNKRLDGLAAEHEEQVEANVEDIETGQIHRSRLSAVGEELESSTREVKTHFADIDRDTRKIIKRIKEGTGHDYYAHRVEKEGEGADKFEIRIRVAARLMIDEVVQALDEAATKWVRERLEQFAVEIKNTTGAIRNDYLRVQEQTVDPEPVNVILRDNLKTATRDGDGNPLPTFSDHLYADDDGHFPVALNKWERTVVETEINRPSFVAWYRNQARATASALRIAYQTDAGDWTSLQPDFLVISKRDDGTLGASIIDPHGDHLADAKNKLNALARYTEHFGDQFVRIESITEVADGTLRSLDLKEESVRQAVEEFTGAEVGALYESEPSRPFR